MSIKVNQTTSAIIARTFHLLLQIIDLPKPNFLIVFLYHNGVGVELSKWYSTCSDNQFFE